MSWSCGIAYPNFSGARDLGLCADSLTPPPPPSLSLFKACQAVLVIFRSRRFSSKATYYYHCTSAFVCLASGRIACIILALLARISAAATASTRACYVARKMRMASSAPYALSTGCCSQSVNFCSAPHFSPQLPTECRAHSLCSTTRPPTNLQNSRPTRPRRVRLLPRPPPVPNVTPMSDDEHHLAGTLRENTTLRHVLVDPRQSQPLIFDYARA